MYSTKINKDLRINLNKVLIDINNDIDISYKSIDDIGLLSGKMGLALFKIYFSKKFKDAKAEKIGIQMIKESISKINNGYYYPTYCSGICGVAWTLDFLKKEELFEIDCDSLLINYDGFLLKKMYAELNVKNLDFLHGAIGYMYYFFNRYVNTNSNSLKEKYRLILQNCLISLEKISEFENPNKIKWLYNINADTGEMGYNFSLSHGISSIINLLAKFCKVNLLTERSEKMLIGAVNYIIENEEIKKNSVSLFPNFIDLKNYKSTPSRLAWCYGDLGIGLSLMKASLTIKNDKLYKRSLEILIHTSKRRSVEKTQVIDACVCHGAFGNSVIFNHLYEITKNNSFISARNYWLNEGLTMREENNPVFLTHKGKNRGWKHDISLLQGISGIGLSILSCLDNQGSNWEECLMIK